MSYALYTIWLLDELLTDRLPPPIGSHKRTPAGGGIPLSKPSTAAAAAAAAAAATAATATTANQANNSSNHGAKKSTRGVTRDTDEEVGEGTATTSPEQNSFTATRAAENMHDDTSRPTWGAGSDWALPEEEPLNNLSSDDSFAAVAYCVAALAVRRFLWREKRLATMKKSASSFITLHLAVFAYLLRNINILLFRTGASLKNE